MFNPLLHIEFGLPNKIDTRIVSIAYVFYRTPLSNSSNGRHLMRSGSLVYSSSSTPEEIKDLKKATYRSLSDYFSKKQRKNYKFFNHKAKEWG